VQSKEGGVAVNTEFVSAGFAQQILDTFMFAMSAMPD